MASSGTRLVAMSDQERERLRVFMERCEAGASYYAEHHISEAAAESADEADFFRSLADRYEHGITEAEARAATVALSDTYRIEADDEPNPNAATTAWRKLRSLPGEAGK